MRFTFFKRVTRNPLKRRMREKKSMRIWERIEFLGPVRPGYSQIWDLQKRRVDEVAAGTAREAIFFCEHESVVTMGRRTDEQNVLPSVTLPIYEIERGGDATWHGPGQLVVYPILKLNGEILKFGLHEYLRFGEEAVIQSFNEFGLETGRHGPTGVWVKRKNGEVKKIASMGIAVRKWITYHGLSINLRNDFDGFDQIRPCNFDSGVMTSAKNEGLDISLKDFAVEIENQMMKILGIDTLLNCNPLLFPSSVSRSKSGSDRATQ